MASIGSVVFCLDCGELLNGAVGDPQRELICAVCGRKNPDTASTSTTTSSKPSTFISALRAKHSAVQNIDEGEIQTDAVIQQACPECGHPELRYYTQQLRSADEGSTIFFHCNECGHKYSLNN